MINYENKAAQSFLSTMFMLRYLLREVVPVDVVAVGVSPWTLDVYPMALQDCGFLEKEDGSLDS